INNSQETLVTLAADTGGKAFLDSNDITAGIVQAQQDLKSYYVLGYYSTNNAEDGKFRKISVKLNGRLDAKLEHRPGYWAGKVWHKMSGQDKEQQLTEAINAGEPLTDIPIALQVDYFRIASTSYFVPVSIKVPGSAVELAAKGGGAFTNFDFLGQIQDEQHAVAGNVRDNIKIKLDQTKSSTAGRKGFQYDAGFTLAPGRYRMKFLVRENVSGKMGTFETKFTIPDLSADTSGLKLSTVIWSSQREPVKSAVGAAERFNRKEVAANPMVVGSEKLIPNITRVFRRNQNLYVNFDVYDARPDPDNPKARRVKVSMSLFDPKGAKDFEIEPLAATQLADTRPEAVPVQFAVPLKGLAPGRYMCQINAVDEVGRKFAFPRAPLVIR
ncbi:MAG TPA: VWA domain-containing protein, partial [Bryobacteraceae bacterium]